MAIDLSDQDVAPDARPPSRLTVGMRLRSAREAAGVELAEVAQRTKIPQRHLAALEADAHDRLPAATFSIGFVRSVARVLGLDPEELAAQFRSEFTRAPAPAPSIAFEPVEPERTPSRRLAWISGGLVAAALLAAFFLGRGEQDTATPTGELAGPTPVVATSPPPPAVTPEMEAAALASQPVTVTAREEAWIQVKDRQSGATVMEGVLAKGQSYSVPTGDLVLRTGRAGALALKVGSRDIPPLGGPVEIVSNVSLQPAALLARAAGPVLPSLPPPPGAGVAASPAAPVVPVPAGSASGPGDAGGARSTVAPAPPAAP